MVEYIQPKTTNRLAQPIVSPHRPKKLKRVWPIPPFRGFHGFHSLCHHCDVIAPSFFHIFHDFHDFHGFHGFHTVFTFLHGQMANLHGHCFFHGHTCYYRSKCLSDQRPFFSWPNGFSRLCLITKFVGSSFQAML